MKIFKKRIIMEYFDLIHRLRKEMIELGKQKVKKDGFSEYMNEFEKIMNKYKKIVQERKNENNNDGK
jgi:flagellar biosynthesis/type III secretory pathway protein FliH